MLQGSSNKCKNIHVYQSTKENPIKDKSNPHVVYIYTSCKRTNVKATKKLAKIKCISCNKSKVFIFN